MKFIPVHGLNKDNQAFRFFVDAETIAVIYPADDESVERGYRTELVLKSNHNLGSVLVTEKMETIIKRITEEQQNG